MGSKWKNAPLFYTVGQIRFNPILSLKTYVEQIQEQLRKKGYPDFRMQPRVRINLAQVAGKPPSEQPNISLEKSEQYSFDDRERTCGFVLDQSALAFHTTNYETFDAFSENLLSGLEIVHGVVHLDYCQRVGVRYLDAVTPLPTENIDQYVVPQVLGIAGSLGEVTVRHSFSETVVELSPESTVTCRTVIQSGAIQFPPDMQGLALNLPDRITAYDGVHALIDTDGAFEGREAFEFNKVKDRLSTLHQEIDRAFSATCTEYALSAWK